MMATRWEIMTHKWYFTHNCVYERTIRIALAYDRMANILLDAQNLNHILKATKNWAKYSKNTLTLLAAYS